MQWHAGPTLLHMNSNGRRSFLKQAATLAGAFSVNSLFHQAHAAEFAGAGAGSRISVPRWPRRTKTTGA